jgi:hypothetical protein
MSVSFRRLFPRSNSSFLLRNGQAIKSEVFSLGKEKFLLDTGIGSPKTCQKGELIYQCLPKKQRLINKVGYFHVKAGESLIKTRISERFFLEILAGNSKIKERTAASLNDLDYAEGSPLILPRRFRQKRAWIELQNKWRTRDKVKGLILRKIKGGFSVGIAGFISFLPFNLKSKRRLESQRFVITTMNLKRREICRLIDS